LRTWLRRLHDEVHVTTVFVTHDQEEALEVADHIVVINGGRVEQAGTPDDLYDHPANDFVMSFLGPATRLRGALVRPHDIDVYGIAVRGAEQAEVVDVQRVGFEVRLSVAIQDIGADGVAGLEGEPTLVTVTRAHYRDLGIGIGDTVWLRVTEGAPVREPVLATIG
jgi:sulfate transport system ATP-binding protein